MFKVFHIDCKPSGKQRFKEQLMNEYRQIWTSLGFAPLALPRSVNKRELSCQLLTSGILAIEKASGPEAYYHSPSHLRILSISSFLRLSLSILISLSVKLVSGTPKTGADTLSFSTVTGFLSSPASVFSAVSSM